MFDLIRLVKDAPITVYLKPSIPHDSAAKVTKKIAEKFHAEHHVVSLENYLSELPKAISIIQMPFWDLHWYYVVKKSKTLSPILISGDGGDELFGGYTFRYQKFLSLTTETSTPLEKVTAYLECHERDRVPDQEKIFDEKSKFSWKSIHQTLLKKPEDTEVVITGRCKNEPSYFELADVYSEMVCHKHYANVGVDLKRGVDY